MAKPRPENNRDYVAILMILNALKSFPSAKNIRAKYAKDVDILELKRTPENFSMKIKWLCRSGFVRTKERGFGKCTYEINWDGWMAYFIEKYIDFKSIDEDIKELHHQLKRGFLLKDDEGKSYYGILMREYLAGISAAIRKEHRHFPTIDELLKSFLHSMALLDPRYRIQVGNFGYDGAAACSALQLFCSRTILKQNVQEICELGMDKITVHRKAVL